MSDIDTAEFVLCARRDCYRARRADVARCVCGCPLATPFITANESPASRTLKLEIIHLQIERETRDAIRVLERVVDLDAWTKLTKTIVDTIVALDTSWQELAGEPEPMAPSR